MTRTTRIILSAMLVAVLALGIALPARAFDAKTGETIVIDAGEVIEDDLYIAASDITVDGTIRGDLVAVGSVITINGTVEGDLITAGSEIRLNGAVSDDVRAAAAAMTLGENASIGDDLVWAGASLETKPGSRIGGDLVGADAQNLLAGEVAGDGKLATAALELRGSIGGDLIVELGTSDEDDPEYIPMTMMGGQGQQIQVPQVKMGLTLAENAKVGGKLEYTYNKEVSIPAGVVSDSVTRLEPKLDVEEMRRLHEANPTPAQQAIKFGLDIVRSFATIVLLGLLLGWILPNFTGKLGETIKTQPLPALGWGAVTYIGFFFSLLVVLIVLIVGAIVFGILTLGGISGLFIWGGIFLLFTLIFGFVVVTAFLAKIVVSDLGGKLILGVINPKLAENKYLPLVVGAFLLAILTAIPFVDFLATALVILFGLGALWLFARQAMQKPAPAE
jgi:cytoskeletal protein CcmA (bactofilin family)